MTLREEEKVILGITWVDWLTEYDFWLRIASQVVSSVLVHCSEFFLHQTAILLYVCGKMHHRDFLGLVNKNAGYSLAVRIVCMLYSLDKKSDKRHLYFVSDLAFFLGLLWWLFPMWWVLFSSLIKHILNVVLTEVIRIFDTRKEVSQVPLFCHRVQFTSWHFVNTLYPYCIILGVSNKIICCILWPFGPVL
jgi:hypothetical protein